MTERLARWSLHATAILAIVAVPGFYFPYVTPRAVLFRILTLIPAALLLLRLRKQRLHALDLRDPILIALTAYATIAAIAAAFGVAPWRSFFGDFERMWGVLTLLHFLLYYVMLRAFFEEQDWRVFFTVLLVAGGAACATAIVQRLLGVVRPAGSFGNPGYLAVYSLIVAGIAIWALHQKQINRKAVFWGLLTASGGFVIAATRGAMLGLVVALLVIALMTPAIRSSKLRPARLAVLSFVLVVIVVSQTPFSRYLPVLVQRVLATSFGGSDSVRLVAWKSALGAAADRPLLGWGPENATPAFNRHFDPDYYLVLPGGDRLDRFHNAYLEALATTGTVGLVAFLALWVAAVALLRAGYRADRLSRFEYLLFLGVLVANATYFLTWFEDLSSFAALLAMLAYIRFRVSAVRLVHAVSRERVGNIIPISGFMVLSAYAVMHGLVPLWAAYHLEQADGNPRLSVEQRIGHFEAALTPQVPQRMHTLLRYTVFVRNTTQTDASIRGNEYKETQLRRAISRIRTETAAERRRDPQNDLWNLIRAQAAIAELSVWKSPLSYYSAIAEHERAIELSPARIRHRLTLARTYLLTRDTTRALHQLRTAARLYPRLGETYEDIAVVYRSVDDRDRAIAYTQLAQSRGHRLTSGILEFSVQALIQREDWRRVNAIVRDQLLLTHGEDWWQKKLGRLNPADRTLAVQQALSALMTRQTRQVADLMTFATRNDPLLLGLLRRMREDAATGNLSDWIELQLSSVGR